MTEARFCGSLLVSSSHRARVDDAASGEAGQGRHRGDGRFDHGRNAGVQVAARGAAARVSGDETSRYAYWLMKDHPDWEVVNQGINGQRSDQIARASKQTLSAHSRRRGDHCRRQRRLSGTRRRPRRGPARGDVRAGPRERHPRRRRQHHPLQHGDCPTRTPECTRSTTGSEARLAPSAVFDSWTRARRSLRPVIRTSSPARLTACTPTRRVTAAWRQAIGEVAGRDLR